MPWLIATHLFQVNTIMFDCRRFQAPDAPSALEGSLTSSGVHGDAIADPKLCEWSGVEVGVHCPVILCELQHARRIVQSNGADYIFGEHTQLLGGGLDVGCTSPEVFRHARSSVPVPSGGHAVTLRDMLEKNDVFALGYALYSSLLSTAEMVRFPDINAAATSGTAFRDWDLPELPAWLSRPVKSYLQRLVTCDPSRRPSLRWVSASHWQ